MKSRIRLGYVIIYVEDVLTIIAFYQDAFGLEQRFLHESHQYVEMETGQTCLAFASDVELKTILEKNAFSSKVLKYFHAVYLYIPATERWNGNTVIQIRGFYSLLERSSPRRSVNAGGNRLAGPQRDGKTFPGS
jgi:hypothetical protein